MSINVLYITWDGPTATYLEGLFLPIFTGLKNYGINVGAPIHLGA